MFTKANKKMVLALCALSPILVVSLLASCAKPVDSKDITIKSSSKLGSAPAEPKIVPTPSPTPVVPLDAATVMLRLRENCYGCHGMGKDKSSFWQTPPEFENPTAAELEVLKAEARAQGKPEPTVEAFESVVANKENLERIITRMETDQFSVEVFQSIQNKILVDDGKVMLSAANPKPMRPDMDDGTRARFIALMDELLKPTPVPSASPTPTPTASATPKAAAVTPLSLAEAKSWCVGCHSPGGSAANVWSKANGSEQDWRSFAATAKDSVQAKRMPTSKLKPVERDEWLRMLAFFQRRMPTVVMEARGKYHGNKLELGVPVDVNYQCKTVRTGREFINELTLNALNRPPTAAELALVPNDSAQVTRETRRLLVERLGNQWREEFISNGIKKFAEKVSSAEKSRTSALLGDQNLKNDIAGEFYQQIRATIRATKSYKDALTSDKVFATKRTGPFYGPTCAAATASLADGQYIECNLKADNSPRSSFFTTLGFLFPKSSSVFQENNNYGRVAAMNEVIRGEPLKANTAGEKGETINPLPTCLQSKDWRVMIQGDTLAPRGTMTVPASGNFCQGCHIRRNLAAGSIVFRPFGPVREYLKFEDILTLRSVANVDPGSLKENENVLLTLYNDAIDPSKWADLPPGTDASRREIIGPNYFSALLNVGKGTDQEVGCVVDPITRQTVTVSTVSELLNHMIADELALPRGLARIVPRALSNRNSTNPEVIEAITDSWKSNGGQIVQLMQAYFMTDTFACKSEAGGM
jgi:mono/diheme cytochrome c family protein